MEYRPPENEVQIQSIGELLSAEHIEPDALLNTLEAYIQLGADIGDPRLLLEKVTPMGEDQLRYLGALGELGAQVHALNIRRSSPKTVERMQERFQTLSVYAQTGLERIIPAEGQPWAIVLRSES